MPVTESSAAANPEGVAHARSAVERWLTWTGLVPLPAFLLLHLARELALAAPSDVSEVVRQPPSAFGLFSSALLVWLPLVLHSGLALWLLSSGGRSSSLRQGDVPASARVASRVCAIIALLFLAYHARQYPLAVLLREADPSDAGFRLLGELSGTSYGVPVRAAAYLLGVAATVAHAGLGLHRALLSEGWLDAAGRRRRSARWCTAAAVLLFCAGAAAVIRVASGVLLR
jgi:succinate dehydrogenase/fumarate reductase cytochrome b subunit